MTWRKTNVEYGKIDESDLVVLFKKKTQNKENTQIVSVNMKYKVVSIPLNVLNFNCEDIN